MSQLTDNLKEQIAPQGKDAGTEYFPPDFPADIFSQSNWKILTLEPEAHDKIPGLIKTWKAVLRPVLDAFAEITILGVTLTKKILLPIEGATLTVRFAGNLVTDLDLASPIALKTTRKTEPLKIASEHLRYVTSEAILEMLEFGFRIVDGGLRVRERRGRDNSDRIVSSYIYAISLNDDKECDSFLSLSEVKHPLSGVPGKARLTISREYRVPTLGHFPIHRSSLIDEKEFANLYKKGDTSLKTKVLPSEGFGLELLSKAEEKQSKEIGDDNKPLFWEYYKLEIKYNFSLSKEHTFIDIIEWFSKCKSAKGVIYEELNFEDSKNYIELMRMNSRDVIEKYSTPDYPLNEKNVEKFIKDEKTIFEQNIQHSIIKFVLLEYLKKHKDELSGKRIDVGGLAFKYTSDEAIKAFCEENEIEFLSDFSSKDENKITIFFIPLSNIVVNMSKWYLELMTQQFWKKNPYNNEEYEVGGGGINDPDNPIVALNPYLFGRESKGFSFGGMTPTEILVHETGHNLAVKFAHKTGSYEYDQTGLQSNISGKIYPTPQNTIDLINDITNRKTIKIK